MSALPPRSESSSRNWWPLSSNKASSSPAAAFPTSSSKKNDPNKFNSLASVMGFKAKKPPHPSLTIQDPPPLSPVYSPPPPSPNRPPSKSVSSVRSQADSMPATPLDSSSSNHRHSLLTLSDDPFASRGIAIPVDPNRLSVYSGNSFSPEFVSKDAPVLKRVSYASSSSHSNYEIASPASSIYESPGRKKLSQKKSLGDIGTHNGYPSGMIKSNSSITLTDKNRFSHPELALTARPPMRARGLTDAAAITYHRPNFLQDAHSPPVSPVSPRVIVRQPSVQRNGLPVSAPPSQQLPPPPATENDTFNPLRFSSTSASSSTSSFRSIRDSSMASQHYIPRSKPVVKETESISKARTLKKAVSHQSLSKTASSSTTSVVIPPLEHIDRAPRKQRSFHHPRIPLPPIPLSLKHQSTGSAVTPSDGMESKRASTNGPPTPGRKRLFSNSSMRRPSTSQDTLADDDHRSVFSLDREKPHGLLTRNLTSKSSFWDETYADTAPSSPHASTLDYTPQQIMSPAEMLKLEADVQESLSISRSRAMSTTSSSTFASVDAEQVSLHTLASSVQSHGLLNPQPPPIRSNSMGSGSVIIPPQLPRPSTSQSASSPSILNNISSPPGFVSLPPPPRSRRPQPTFTPPSNEVPLLKPLSPPPRTRIISKKASAEMVNSRRTSLMRKPSFLDIDDDVEKSPPPLTREASFLDLARESLDTVRSDTEDEEQCF